MKTITITKQPNGVWTVDVVGHAHIFHIPDMKITTFWSRVNDRVKNVNLQFNGHGQLLEIHDVDGSSLDELVIPKTHWLWLEMIVGKPFKG